LYLLNSLIHKIFHHQSEQLEFSELYAVLPNFWWVDIPLTLQHRTYRTTMLLASRVSACVCFAPLAVAAGFSFVPAFGSLKSADWQKIKGVAQKKTTRSAWHSTIPPTHPPAIHACTSCVCSDTKRILHLLCMLINYQWLWGFQKWAPCLLQTFYICG
jgi:hypothetical protein